VLVELESPLEAAGERGQAAESMLGEVEGTA
jgi:hypothetical protein